jgi:poly-gamma-glutamate synthesis protein (capsule biosynthesis protein)
VVSDAAAASNNADASGSNPVQIKVTFAGDCTVGTDENFNYSTSMPAKWEDVDGDATYFLKNVASIFEDDDLTVVNMEGTLTTGGSRADKTFAFKGKPEYAKIFSSSSVEAASLANNHSKDYGTDSYTDTIEAMEAEGVQTFGYDRIAYTEIKGVKVALVGAYALNETYDYVKEMTDNIAKAREEGAQLVLVYVHWGIEKEYVPNETQMSMGHAAIDAGADLVIGSHPHVVQGYEVYQGRYIVYSLGNFCFGGNSNPSDKDCMIFQQTFTVSGEDVEKNGDVEFIACSISSSSSTNNYQPTPAEGSEKERIMKKFQESSDEIAEMAKEMSQGLR